MTPVFPESEPPLPDAPGAPAPWPILLVLNYLKETLAADPLAPLVMGLKRSLKAGAALHTGLERVAPGPVRLQSGRYVLFACLQLDTLVDALPDFERASQVHAFVRACVEGSVPRRTLWRQVLACRGLTLGQRLKALRILQNLDRLVRDTEALLDTPERRRFFRDTLGALITAVVEDMNLEARARDTLVALAPEYPAMGLSGLEVLWLLQGRPLEEILAYRQVLGQGEQLARLEDDVLEVWKAFQELPDEAAVEARVDRRNLILRHAKNLGWTMRASLTEACRIAGFVEQRLEGALGGIEDAATARELRRVVTFFPTYVDMMIGQHRVAAPARAEAAEPPSAPRLAV
ncbi:hypothetical protein [Archangium primigenium]|uniref:hypothetical protein n=1 Tax=[Archangium] primigenium TaxID=2792470 RepID=UPI0019564C0B|nr:hypothetical protein [Archangium primigenium]MBM7113036.1 hypothetical protein [Archangium primigenium]